MQSILKYFPFFREGLRRMSRLTLIGLILTAQTGCDAARTPATPARRYGFPAYMAFLRDGKTLVTQMTDPDTFEVGNIAMFDVGGTKVCELPLRLRRVATSPDEKLIAVGAWHRFALWDLSCKPRERLSFPGEKDAGAEHLAFSADSRFLAWGSFDFVGVWDIAGNKEVCRLREHAGSVGALAFSPDGSFLASAGGNPKAVRVWETKTWKLVHTLPGHERPRGYQRAPIIDIAFSPDSKTLAWADVSDLSIHLFDMTTGRELRVLRGHVDARAYALWDIAWSPDGKWLVSAGYENPLRIWDPSTGKEVRTIEGDHGFSQVAFTPDGKRLASAASEWFIIWDFESGKPLVKIPRVPTSAAKDADAPGGQLAPEAK